MDFQRESTHPIYQGRVFNVRQDQVRLPNGNLTKLDIVEHPGAVVLVPVDDEGFLWFVRQYRHAAGEALLELPAGTTEKGEELTICAQRELREETGMSSREITKLGEFFIAPGYSTEFVHIYLASGLQPDPLPGDDDEFIQVERIPIAQAYSMAENGQFRDAKTLAALMLARQQL